ncbi:unnamed protein product [Debaryomyces tyrocola]|nr:unnamed protein product [Debaryomyces tyrocola]
MLRGIPSNTSLQIHTAGECHKELMISKADSGESNDTYIRRSSESGFDDEEVSSVSLSDLSLEENRRERRQESSTPPTPSCMAYSSCGLVCKPAPIIECSASGQNEIIAPKPTPFVESRQDEFLLFIEPSPVLPPNYNLLPPGGCPKFPLLAPIDVVEDNILPPYTPSVYKIGVVCRKIEWLSPYEPSPTRSWKNVIIELNSTQLNFYAIPGPVENHVLSFKPSVTPRERIFNDAEEEEMTCINSELTSSADLQFFKYTQRLGLLNSLDDESPNTSSSGFSSLTSKSRSKNKRLLRSYSLQHARLGLATDYKKRPNVLRVRIESEQLLLNFSMTQDLIDWHAAFCSGRDVSLDILQRELPRERTLPRRRRRRSRSRSRRNSQNSFASRNDSFLSQFNASNGEPSKLKDKVLRFKSKFLSRTKSVDLSKSDDKNSLTSISNANLQRARSPSLPTFNISNIGDDDDDDDSENLYTLNEYRGTQNNRSHVNTLRDDDYEDDIQNLSDLHASDDEDDEEFDCNIADFNENNDNEDNEDNEDSQRNRERLMSMPRRFTLPSSVSSSSNNYKWYPSLDKPQSQRKYYRNCLRCIKPLTAEDVWVNRSVVKPTTLSPISFAYLRNIKYANSNSESSSSLASLGSQAISTSYTNTQSSRKRSLSFKDGAFTLPDVALTRLPNHFLKEYLVGSHGLIPKEV